MRSRGIAIGGALVLAIAAFTLPAVASPQPTPVCPVCGQTFHENVTATDATLQVQADGDVAWRVENEVREPTAAEWRENETALRDLVAHRIDRTSTPPFDPATPDVRIEGDTATIQFVDRRAARQRLGLLVVPYLHGEGVQARYVVNADEFVVVAPDGQRVVNEPAGATVDGDRAVWRGVASTDRGLEGDEVWDAPEPDDTYVVVGAGATAGVRSTLVTGFEPLDPRSYGWYVLGLLFVVGLTYGAYTLQGNRFERRFVAGAVVLVILPYLYLVASLHPISGGLGGFFDRVLAAAATLLVGLLGALLLGGGAVLAARRSDRSS